MVVSRQEVRTLPSAIILTFNLSSFSDNKYFAVKILARTPAHSEAVLSKELKVYEHLSKVRSSHIGQAYIRALYDTFDISSPCGVHRCLVHPPMHMSIHALRMRAMSCKLSEPLLKQTLICLLQALDFLHREANIVHCGTFTYSSAIFLLVLTL